MTPPPYPPRGRVGWRVPSRGGAPTEGSLAVLTSKRLKPRRRRTAMAQPQRITPIESVDPIWARIRSEAEAVVRQEPQLASFIYASLLEHDTLTGPVVHRISDRLDHPAMTRPTILQAFLHALAASPHIVAP